MTTAQKNMKLTIVHLSDFLFETEKGFVSPNGYAFCIPGLGFVKFKHDKENLPYMPCYQALKEIKDAGGFIHYNDIEFILDYHKKILQL